MDGAPTRREAGERKEGEKEGRKRSDERNKKEKMERK